MNDLWKHFSFAFYDLENSGIHLGYSLWKPPLHFVPGKPVNGNFLKGRSNQGCTFLKVFSYYLIPSNAYFLIESWPLWTKIIEKFYYFYRILLFLFYYFFTNWKRVFHPSLDSNNFIADGPLMSKIGRNHEHPLFLLFRHSHLQHLEKRDRKAGFCWFPQFFSSEHHLGLDIPESKERGLKMSFSDSFGDTSLQMLDRVGFRNIFTHEQVKEWHNIVVLKK